MNEKTHGRQPLAAQAEPTPQAPNAALLVDFDNVTMGIRSDLQTQLRKLLNSDIIRGKVSVQRAYADWRRYPQYIVPLTEASIDLIFAPAVGANKKNATDIRLAIDALELVFTRPEIGTFILLSGDSDFSALVLKLKEYGKFVIGVGIRESSSDLLVQNCDEYYSYNELTGLAKTGDVEITRRDPWELVVEAVEKMLHDGDVMRSDRLKQVMQSIDPNFDERDVGCNRFSKFVAEAGQRGLLRLTKMDNGQFAVDLGTNANVQGDREAPVAKQKESTAAPPARRKRSTRRETLERTLTLSEGLDLLKRALLGLEAFGKNATEAETARQRMIEIHGDDTDPLFEKKRLVRMLRQAHDADVIELIKSDNDDYELKLSATAAAELEEAATKTPAPDSEPEEPEEPADDSAEAEEKPKRTTARKKTTRKSTRSRTRAAAKEPSDDEAPPPDAEEQPAEEEEKPKRTVRKKTTKKKTTKKKTTSSRAKKAESELAEAEESSEIAEPVDGEEETKPKKTTKKTAKKTTRKKTSRSEKETEEPEAPSKEKAEPATPVVNPRFRKGSRSAAPKPPPTEKAEASSVEKDAAPPKISVSQSPPRLGMRSGSRGTKRVAKSEETELDTKAAKADEVERDLSETVRSESVEVAPVKDSEDSPPDRATTPREKPEVKGATETETPKATTPDTARKVEKEPVAEPEQPTDADDDGMGLFRRVSAAFQRAMGTTKDDSQ